MLVLQVNDGSVTCTYTDEDSLQEVDINPRQEENDGVVEMEEVEVLLHGSFLGKDDIFALPDDNDIGYRAILTIDGITIINGRVRRSDLTHDELEEEWSIIVIASAVEDLFSQMDDLDLDVGTTVTRSISTDVMFDDNTTSNETHTIYHLRQLWNNSIDQVTGITVVYDPASMKFFDFDIRWIDGSMDEQTQTFNGVALWIWDPARGSATDPYLPDWKVSQLYELLRDMLGWKVRVSYADYPSTNIIFEILSDQWLSPSGLDAIDEYITDEEYSLGYEGPERVDFAITYASRFNEDRLLDDDDVLADQYTSLFAHYYGLRIATDPDGKPQNETVIELPVHLPQLTDLTTQALSVGGFNYTEHWATPVVRSRGIVYVAGGYVGGFGPIRWKIVPDDPASDEFTQIEGAYAAMLHDKYQITRRRRFTCTAGVDLNSLGNEPLVSSPLRGVSFKEKNWVIKAREVDRFLGTMTVEMITQDPNDTTDEPTFELPEVEIPTDVKATFVITDDDPIEQYEITISWQPPTAPAQQSPDNYEIEESVDSGSWNLIHTESGAGDLIHVVNRDETTTNDFRVRSTTTGGDVSEWVVANNIGP